MKNKCKNCGKNYKVLTEEDLCYYCHVDKYGRPPKGGCYESGDWNRPMGGLKKVIK